MKTLFNAQILNGYRSDTPKGFYDPIKKHTGEDLQFDFDFLPAPCDLEILKLNIQNEMGKVIYAKDKNNYIHVFAHLNDFRCKVSDKIKKDQVFALTGNTGIRTTGSHLHYEVLTPSGINPGMERLGLPYNGDNVNPREYLLNMEKQLEPWRLKVRSLAKSEGIVTDVDAFLKEFDGDRILAAILKSKGISI